MRSVIATPLSWKYGFPCESLTPFSISCMVIIGRGPAPNLSRTTRGEPVSSFLFSTITMYKSILAGFSVITFRY